jgi:hypothetical protein
MQGFNVDEKIDDVSNILTSLLFLFLYKKITE